MYNYSDTFNESFYAISDLRTSNAVNRQGNWRKIVYTYFIGLECVDNFC